TLRTGMCGSRLPVVLILFALLAAAGVSSQTPGANGASLYKSQCRACHDHSAATGAPDLETLRHLSPRAVIAALTDGAMRYQGLSLTGAERRTLAEYMTGRPIDEVSSAANIGLCGIDPPLGDRPRGPTWNGWSPTPANTHFQPAR